MANHLIKKATLIEVDGRKMTSDARFHANLLADYVISKFLKNSEKWIDLREAAHVMYHSGAVSNQDKINSRLHKLFEELKNRGHALVVEPSTKAFKIYSGAESEKQYMLRKHKFWGDRRKSSQDKEGFIADSLLGDNAA